MRRTYPSGVGGHGRAGQDGRTDRDVQLLATMKVINTTPCGADIACVCSDLSHGLIALQLKSPLITTCTAEETAGERTGSAVVRLRGRRRNVPHGPSGTVPVEPWPLDGGRRQEMADYKNSDVETDPADMRLRRTFALGQSHQKCGGLDRRRVGGGLDGDGPAVGVAQTLRRQVRKGRLSDRRGNGEDVPSGRHL